MSNIFNRYYKLSFSIIRVMPLTDTFTPSLSLSRSLTHYLTHLLTLSLSLTLSLTHSLTLFLSLTIYLSLTHNGMFSFLCKILIKTTTLLSFCGQIDHVFNLKFLNPVCILSTNQSIIFKTICCNCYQQVKSDSLKTVHSTTNL